MERTGHTTGFSPSGRRWGVARRSPRALDVEETLGLAKSLEACHFALCSLMLPDMDTLRCLQTGTTMNEAAPLHIPLEELGCFCRRYQVRELALFGSMLRQDHHPESDVSTRLKVLALW